MRLLILISACLLCTQSVVANIWHVGPTLPYSKPSQVANLAQTGDTVLIEAGIYADDVARWTADQLLIQGINGRAHLKSGGNVYGGKAIWVIVGDDVTVENIEFSEAACPDRNGAGIRSEGINLIIRNCYFHHNENGILAGDIASGDFLIEYSEFAFNGYADGQAHNLYINHANSLTFQFNYSHDANVGHELKSRALNNFIYCNRFSDEAGTASRSIDLPNGGFTIIMGNVIVQDPLSQNSNLVGYGMEGLNNPNSALYITYNTFVNNKTTGSFIQFPNTAATIKIWNNIFAGPGAVISGNTSQLDTLSNVQASIEAMQFANPGSYDFRIAGDSPAATLALAPGEVNGLSLTPAFAYEHPAGRQHRPDANDAGAYGIQEITEVKTPTGATWTIFPNPTTGLLHLGGLHQKADCNLFNLQGERLMSVSQTQVLDLHQIPPGMYILEVLTDTSRSVLNLVKT